MGRKIKKVIMIAAFGMVTGGQIADLLPEGNVMQVEAGSRKQIIKVKNILLVLSSIINTILKLR